MTVPTSYTLLVEDHVKLFHLMPPTERIENTLHTLRRLTDAAAYIGEIERARAIDALLDADLRDSILLACSSEPELSTGLSQLFWSAAPEHTAEMAVISHVGGLLAGQSDYQTGWWRLFHNNCEFNDPTLVALQQMTETFTSARLRHAFEANAEVIAEDVELREYEWINNFSEFVEFLGRPLSK